MAKKTLAEKLAALTPEQRAKYWSGAYGTGDQGIKNVLNNTSLAGQAGKVEQIDLTKPWVGETPLGPANPIQLLPGFVPPPEAEVVAEEEDETDGETGTGNPNARANLRAEFKNYLAQYGLDTPGMVGLVEQAVANDWSIDKFLLEMRQSADYLANPLFAANLERVKQGKRFMAEGEILTWRDEAKRLAKQYGYKEPSDNYLAVGLQSGLSMAEIEHRYSIQKNVNEMGGGVRWVYENILGQNITDEDLYEIFDPEFDTADRDEAYKDAMYRGRPMALGLGVRSQAEADAFKALGVNVDEAFKRYEGLDQNASRFQRLGAIEDLITQGLPDDFGNFSTEENSTLVRALLFNDSEALAKMQGVISREVARFKTGGVQATQGQLVSLLTDEQKASYG